MSAAVPGWREPIAELRYLAAKVGSVHGQTHPDMATLAEVVATLADSHGDDHAAHVALARRMRELTDGFNPWSGSCGSVRRLYQSLAPIADVLSPALPEHS